MSRPRDGARSWLARPRRWRVLSAMLAVALGGLGWAALAGGSQPDDTYQSTIAADGPVAQYRFSDAAGSSTLADSAGSDTATNSGITLAGGGPFGGGKSGAFTSEAYASLASNPLAGATAFTVEGWVNWTTSTSYNQPIFDLGSGVTNHMSLTPASSASGHPMLFEIEHSSIPYQITAPKLATGWQYVAVTEEYTAAQLATITVYVNGAEVGHGNSAWRPASLETVAHSYLGKPVVSGPATFKGSLSNVAFYNKALTAAQIKAHYNAGEFPVNTVTPGISGTLTDEKELTAKANTWTGLTPIEFKYEWQRCTGSECVQIAPPSKEAKYKLGHTDVGSAVRVVVTAENSA